MVDVVFPFGSMARGEDVVDRESYIREMVMRMEDGQSAVIAGPRRIGKSSVGREILRQAQVRGQYVASVDLFSANSTDTLASFLMQSILENRVGRIRRGVRSLAGLRRLVGTPDIKAKMGDLEIGLNWSEGKSTGEDELLRALAVAEEIAARGGRRMVILLDEFQDIERLGGLALLKRLRAVMQAQQHTVFLFLGSQPSLMKMLFASQSQAFYRFATFCPLPAVPSDAWVGYIGKKLAEQNMTVTPAALDLMLEKTGGHPYCVMGVVYHSYLMAKGAGLGRVDADIAVAADARMMDHLSGIYEQQWLEVRRVAHADAVCLAVSEQKPPYSLDVPRSSVGKALNHLLDLGLIEKRSVRGDYVLVEPMFGRWLRERFS